MAKLRARGALTGVGTFGHCDKASSVGRGDASRYDGRDEAAGADIKPLVDLVIPIGESPAVWLISGRRSLKLERFHDDAPAWSAAASTAAMGHGTLDIG